MNYAKKTIKLFFKSKAFTISVIVLFLYAIFYHTSIVFNADSLGYVFYYLLGLLPIVLLVFAILVSFTDKEFLKFLKDTPIDKDAKDKTSVYDGIVYYFKLNTIWILLSLISISTLLWFAWYDFLVNSIPIFQYLILFLVVYTTISFFNVVRFIFYYANKKAEFSTQ